MQAPKAIISLSAVALGLTIGHTAASAASIERVNFDDNAFDDLSLVKDYTAESRIGNARPSGTQEIQFLKTKPSFKVFEQDQFAWENGEEYKFTLGFNAITEEVTYSVEDPDDSTKKSTISSSEIAVLNTNAIYLRARTTDNSSLQFSDFAIEDGMGTSTLDGPIEVDGEGAEYVLKISDIQDSFQLTGNSIFNWTGQRPKNSQLAYQFKVVAEEEQESPEAVPEPATMSLFSLGVIGLAMSRRRKQA